MTAEKYWTYRRL